ncbi:conserved hypothetical protein [Stutzerimonas stutzeri A1501]|uniref:Uncharacterized protein n=1 Tax=Stutzerimonas stutzeri (strain A1501) TaxID=379731 RepID=A4VPW6_STUS1|nr:conserved hypothetical protein [Stutzerimonas stutzeri A1501]
MRTLKLLSVRLARLIRSPKKKGAVEAPLGQGSNVEGLEKPAASILRVTAHILLEHRFRLM